MQGSCGCGDDAAVLPRLARRAHPERVPGQVARWRALPQTAERRAAWIGNMEGRHGNTA